MINIISLFWYSTKIIICLFYPKHCLKHSKSCRHNLGQTQNIQYKLLVFICSFIFKVAKASQSISNRFVSKVTARDCNLLVQHFNGFQLHTAESQLTHSVQCNLQGGPKKSKPPPIFQKNRIKDCHRDQISS